MGTFEYRDDSLWVEECSVGDLIARFGTPWYIYSRAAIEQAWRSYEQAFMGSRHLICYAVKANSNLAILDLLARLGSGFDIVSIGELERVLKVGGRPDRIVFAGVGKSVEEMRRALTVGIRCFNVESGPELLRLHEVAKSLGMRAPVALRVNPDVDPKTHPYISTGLKQNKFGVAMSDAMRLYRQAAALPYLEIVGVGVHIGSQLTDLEPVFDAVDRLGEMAEALKREGIQVRHVDIGGGLGIRYRDEHPPSAEAYAQGVLARLGSLACEILMEPGRSIVGNGGILVTKVEYLKYGDDRNFAIVDAAMNDLMRPALYGAWQDIVPVERRAVESKVCDVVGPVCESGDFLGKERSLPVAEGDLLAILSAGAYGFSMSSNYNSRPRAAEVMVDGAQAYCIRSRESLAELWAGESLLPS
jgi:diaminopimelate decarboxylase